MTNFDIDHARLELNEALRALQYETTERARVLAAYHTRLALLLLSGSTTASIVGYSLQDPEHV